MGEYLVLSQDEQDDIIVAFIHSQEKDRFCHELNLARYTEILSTVKEDGWRDKLQVLYDETVQRLAEVNSIIAATLPQMPPKDRLEAAKARLSTGRSG